MNQEVKVTENSIYKVIPKDEATSEKIWSILSEVLPKKDCIFAAFSTAPGKYVWSMPGDGWVPITKVDEDTADRARELLLTKRKAVAHALAAFPALRIDALFTIPSEEYFFVRMAPDGSLEIMLTAWDYKLPARQEGSDGRVVTTLPKKRQDVVLKFVEAGKPVPGYGLQLKLFDGKYTAKKTDAAGCFPMPGLAIGNRYTIYSSDRSKDFSFVVEAGVTEIVFDITDNIKVEVKVNRDDSPSAGETVKISFAGEEYAVTTGPDGIARQEVPYKQDAEVIARVEGSMQNAPAEYPLARLEFDLHTPMASIVVEYLRNGKPVAGEQVFVRVQGMESLVLSTNASGQASCKVPMRAVVDVTAEVGPFNETRPLEAETFFRFNERVPVRFDPAIRVKNTDGALMPGYPVIVNLEGRREEYRTDTYGLIDLRSVLAGAEMLIRDGKNPDNVRSYILDEDILVYELVVPVPVIEKYHIALVPAHGDELPEGLSLILQQGTRELIPSRGEDGRYEIPKDDLVAGSPVTALIRQGGTEFGRVSMEFVREENDYEIEVNMKRKKDIGAIMKQVLAGLAVAALAAGAFAAFLLLF